MSITTNSRNFPTTKNVTEIPGLAFTKYLIKLIHIRYDNWLIVCSTHKWVGDHDRWWLRVETLCKTNVRQIGPPRREGVNGMENIVICEICAFFFWSWMQSIVTFQVCLRVRSSRVQKGADGCILFSVYYCVRTTTYTSRWLTLKV